MIDAPPSTQQVLPSGVMIGGYRIARAMGEGAQATVYEASRADGTKVALKVIHRHLLGDPQIFGRFHREAKILKRLEGEHLVKFVDFIEEDGLLVIALELVEARSLEALLTANKPIDIGLAVEIALQVCAALGVAHAADVVHRDLKPANVLVEEGDEMGAPPRVRVVDFGLAKVVHGDLMTTGLTEQDMIFGTPEYMAPEQARGDEADGRADLYATGVILYEMVVGKVPFKSRTPLATMTAHLTEPPPPPRAAVPTRGVSPALEAVILRALAKSPDDRYTTARAFAEALVAARDKDVVVISPRKLDDPGRSGDDWEGLSTRDTDLHVLVSSKTLPMVNGPISRRDPGEKTKPSAIADAAVREAIESITAKQAKLAAEAAMAPSKPTPSARVPASARGSRERIVWILVAIFAAAVGIAIGALVGAR